MNTRPHPHALRAADPRGLALSPRELSEIDAALGSAAAGAAEDAARLSGAQSRECFAQATAWRELARRIRVYLDALPRESFK